MDDESTNLNCYFWNEAKLKKLKYQQQQKKFPIAGQTSASHK